MFWILLYVIVDDPRLKFVYYLFGRESDSNLVL
jgi:hypothetical protein